MNGESHDGDSPPELVDERAVSFGAEADYGANLHSLLVLDILWDQSAEDGGVKSIGGSPGNDAVVAA